MDAFGCLAAGTILLAIGGWRIVAEHLAIARSYDELPARPPRSS